MSGLERLYRDWERLPEGLRRSFQANHNETVSLRAQVARLEQELARERERCAFERRLTRHISRPRTANVGELARR